MPILWTITLVISERFCISAIDSNLFRDRQLIITHCHGNCFNCDDNSDEMRIFIDIVARGNHEQIYRDLNVSSIPFATSLCPFQFNGLHPSDQYQITQEHEPRYLAM